MRNPDAAAAYRYNSPFQQVLSMDGEHLVHHCNTLCSGDVGQSHHAVVRCLFDKEKLAEILVHRHQNLAFGSRPFEKNAVTRVRSSFPRLDDIMTAFPQMCRQAPARAAID